MNDVEALNQLTLAAQRPFFTERLVLLQMLGILLGAVTLAASAVTFGEHQCKGPTRETSCDAARFGLVLGCIVVLATMATAMRQLRHIHQLNRYREGIAINYDSINFALESYAALRAASISSSANV